MKGYHNTSGVILFRFPNDPCVASGSRNGTCYTEAECESKSGVASGSCAAGFGVCCICKIRTIDNNIYVFENI